jgi:hypothetical protein
LAVTVTLSLKPTSAEASRYDALVAPEIEVQELAPQRDQL